jgi:flagellar biosynthesis protein FliQ
MSNPLQNALASVSERFIAYLPNLVAGIVLVGIGWLLGWVLKRIVVRLMSVLRVDRLLRRFRWGASFERADVRYALYEFSGNVVFVVVLLVFLNASLEVLQLTALSSILQQGVLFIPRLLIAALIFALGWIVAGWIGASFQKALTREEVPRPTLIARFVKVFVLLFASAMALTELDVAREIVIVGFTVTMVTLGALAVVLTSLGGKRFAGKILESMEE